MPTSTWPPVDPTTPVKRKPMAARPVRTVRRRGRRPRATTHQLEPGGSRAEKKREVPVPVVVHPWLELASATATRTRHTAGARSAQ